MQNYLASGLPNHPAKPFASNPLAAGLPDERSESIVSLCNHAGFPELARQFIEDGDSVTDVRNSLLEAMCIRQNGNRPLSEELAAIVNPALV